VAQTFFMDDEVKAKAKLDAVVTVADAKHLLGSLAGSPEAQEQIGFADVILLNKTDLVSAGELREVEARIRAINPHACPQNGLRDPLTGSSIAARSIRPICRSTRISSTGTIIYMAP
jgi:hypothetical protein